ncbi:MAG: hypothetical protein ACI4C3_01735, partial [Bacteroides sp.]
MMYRTTTIALGLMMGGLTASTCLAQLPQAQPAQQLTQAQLTQDAWSLRRCIDYAIEHNVSIKQTANAAEQSAVEVNTARWARLPN